MKWPKNEQGSNNREEDAQILMFSFNSICLVESFYLHHHKSSKQDKINLFINKIKTTKLNSKALTNQKDDPALANLFGSVQFLSKK